MKKEIKNAIVAVVAVFGLSIQAYYWVRYIVTEIPEGEQTEVEQDVHEVDSYTLRYYTKEYMEQNLDDPDSYEPIDFYDFSYSKKDGLYSIVHEFRAKNKFGGLVRDKARFYYMDGFGIVEVKKID